jgi:2-polyprenyl-3-methyl-5-hydroxy-6-metoxy-1,4-benzoquinol methylase
LDFGCGVGRLSLAIAQYAKSVTGIDISSGHLEKAEEHRQNNNAKNVEFKIIRSDLKDVLEEKFDVIISLIVLQHNRPELMKSMIKQLLSFLTDDGFALLHIPFSIPNYRKKTGVTNVMEMHFLPISEIEQLAQESGYFVKQYNCDYCGGDIKNAIFYFSK